MAQQHLEAIPIPINEYVPDVPAAWKKIIMKVLAKNLLHAIAPLINLDAFCSNSA